MCYRIKENFDKYWSEYSVVLAFGTILDSMKKLNFLKYTYSKLDSYGCGEKLERVRKTLYKLFKEYSNKGASTFMTSCFEEFDCQEANNIGKFQLDLYLEEPRISFSGNFAVLGYWRDRSNKFGDIAKMACDVLSIPITNVASKFVFSIGSRVLSKYRSSMINKTVQALICTRNWLLCFVGKLRFCY